MSNDYNFSFPDYINKYYHDAFFRQLTDRAYEMIHSGQFSAEELREAVTLAENKEQMYGHREMPTATVGPMPGDKPKQASSRPSQKFTTKVYARGMGSLIPMFSGAKSLSMSEIASPYKSMKLFEVTVEWPENPTETKDKPKQADPDPIKRFKIGDRVTSRARGFRGVVWAVQDDFVAVRWDFGDHVGTSTRSFHSHSLYGHNTEELEYADQ